MKGYGSFSVQAGAFAICALAASFVAGLTLLTVSGSWTYDLGSMLLGIGATMLFAAPVVLLAGLFVALPLNRFVLSGTSLPVYLTLSISVAAMAGYAAETMIFCPPYVTGSFVIPAAAAGGVSAGLWHRLVRKKKVSTHG